MVGVGNLNLEQAAELAGCSVKIFRELLNNQLAPGARIGIQWVIPRDHLDKWIEKQTSGARPSAIELLAAYKRNRMDMRNAVLRWRRQEPKRLAYALAHPPKRAPPLHPPSFHVAKRRASKLQRTPEWADVMAIANIYRECRRLNKASRVRYEVDHVIPLQGRTVSGLHVPENLQIITRKSNLTKHNRYDGAAQ